MPFVRVQDGAPKAVSFERLDAKNPLVGYMRHAPHVASSEL